MSNTSLKTTAEWHEINWRKLERRVYKLQKRIYQASNRGDVENSSQTPKDVNEVLVSKMSIGSSGNTR